MHRDAQKTLLTVFKCLYVLSGLFRKGFDRYRMLYNFVEPMYECTFKVIEAMEQKMEDKK